MKVSRVDGICSMLVVYDNPKPDIKKVEFLKRLYSAIKEHNQEVREYNDEVAGKGVAFKTAINIQRIKTIMLVSTKGWASYPFMNNGYKYEGNEIKPARVKYLNCKYGLDIMFIKNGIGELKL